MSTRRFALGLAAALALVPLARARAQEQEPERARRPNVLFVSIDDLRPELGCYGAEGLRTPNIDRLAAGGVLFERAYCMVPTCGASRASLLTGLRPTPKRFVDFLTWAEADAPGIVTLNTHFKTNGYLTLSNGKVFHHAKDSASGWSEPPWRPGGSKLLHLPENQPKSAERDPAWRSPAFEAADVAAEEYIDGEVLERSLTDLRRLAARDEPFFLAVGFYRPHLPFVAPQKYWDLYDRDQIHLPETYHRPHAAPDEAIHTWPELRTFRDIPPKGPLSDELARTLIHGYYACVSFIDAEVGVLLDELARLGLADNTIVVLWGDHGWSLGEHGMWCKGSCFETVMRAPLIVRAPGFSAGLRTRSLVEFIDVYPTLCELTGLPLPAHLQGQSLVPLMKGGQTGKTAAIGRFLNGDTIRTERYRFTEYTDVRGQVRARMLYDLAQDPGEDVNVAEQAELADEVAALGKLLQAGKGKDDS